MMPADDLIASLNSLNEQGDCQAALDLAVPVLNEQTTDYALWIGAGNAYYGLRRYEDAKQAYLKAAALNPDDVIALSNLAGFCFETGRYEEGLDICEQALKRQPDYANVLIHRGNILSSLNRHQEAETAYRLALKSIPDDPLVLFNLAYTLMISGKTDEAERIYRQLLEIAPDDEEYLFAYASFFEKREAFDKAAEIYLRLLKIKPDDTTHITLSGCLYNLLLQEKTERVMALTDEWLSLFPENPAALHMFETLKPSREVKRASAAYVQELFDAFADSFDSVLESLSYQAPALIAAAVKEIGFSRPPETLDLGCGTGLCGAAMAANKIPLSTLTGVDLSSGMLEKAKQRELYTELCQEDIITFLPLYPARFDLVVSADVLTYLGDLSALFSGLSAAVKSGGRIVFTVSENTQSDEGYAMEPSGRFMHGKKYILRELEKNGFKTVRIRSVELRQELGKPVQGLLVVAKNIKT